jgi:hypothetical protein
MGTTTKVRRAPHVPGLCFRISLSADGTNAATVIKKFVIQLRDHSNNNTLPPFMANLCSVCDQGRCSNRCLVGVRDV